MGVGDTCKENASTTVYRIIEWNNEKTLWVVCGYDTKIFAISLDIDIYFNALEAR